MVRKRTLMAVRRRCRRRGAARVVRRRGKAGQQGEKAFVRSQKVRRTPFSCSCLQPRRLITGYAGGAAGARESA